MKILLNFKKTTEEKEVSSEDCYNPLVQQANPMLGGLDHNLFLSVFTKLAQWNLFNERNFNLVKKLADMDIDTVDSVLSILDLDECPCDKQWFFERIVATSMLDYALPVKVAQLWKEGKLSRDTVENLLVNQCSRPRAKTFG